MSKPQDSAQREEVLDISRSFIVQAPAGSGKTSLLTQRFLQLLTIVNHPEEILAITFTNKAAAEMHHRIIESIKLATKPKPESDFEAQTWMLAAQVLQRDADCQWHLLQNPKRLRVQTIDSLCAHLTKQMPVTARFGSPPSIQQDASDLYTEAARNCLQALDSNDETGQAIAVLMTHVDNQMMRAEGLISAMLASRDQWLRYVMTGASAADKRATLEAVLQRTVASVLSLINKNISAEERRQLAVLVEFAASNTSDKSAPVHLLTDDFDGLNDSVDALPYWLALADFLLTKSDTWRKQADAKMGFPAPTGVKNKEEAALYKAKKADFKALLEELQTNAALTDAIGWLRCLPNPRYNEQQWQFIQALMRVLPVAVAHLRLVFQQAGCVDFCEVSLSASSALHDSTGMTDVGLRLDYQLHHLLVDEFQDTSETQFMLIRDLVAGWQEGDGRTLFLVGDPMQSIYRFRQADVGLFLKTQQDGLGEVRNIAPMDIAVNFRSQQAIVDWVNRAFKQLMPKTDNVFSGAISYKPSIPFKTEPSSNDAVHYYPHANHVDEGNALLSLIQSIQQKHPNDTMGVLVRGRRSLLDLVAALNKAGVAYQATDIDPLNTRQTVIDLMSLTRAYLQSADRIAWLSVLRAPWCALSLTDMHCLLTGAADEPIWSLLQDKERVMSLSKDGQQSLLHIVEQFTAALANRERMSVADTVIGLWNNLRGPECLQYASDLADSERFIECLSALESSGGDIELSILEQHIEKLYAAPNANAPATLQIMTIHKAKGLEFDHVILPGLDRKAGNDEKRLLAWLERPGEQPGSSELMIAPIKETGADTDDAIASYLNKVEQEKTLHESQRLLYVAATRAKKQLHLSFCLKVDEMKGEPKKPASNTLLGLLWSSIKNDIDVNLTNDEVGEINNTTNCYITKLDRVDLNYIDCSSDNYQHDSTAIERPQTHVVEFDWATDLAASIGTVCHQWMQILGERGDTLFDENTPAIQHQLLEAGVLPQHLDEATDRVNQILTQCLQDKRGLWVLNNQHQESEFEFPLSGVVNGSLVHTRLDRTFVDDGKRWIVDYKTSRHDDDNKEQFLDNEMTRYQSQLEGYARLMQALDSRPIHLGLYYPAFGGWRTWVFEG
jgi:ATP-dependent helicase/nuclease subunit A